MPSPFWIPTLGGRGEYLVRRYLHRRGYHLLARNWRHGKGELDLVMACAGHVVFCEVKTRQKGGQRRLADLLHPRQEKRLLALVEPFLNQYEDRQVPWRFLLFEVILSPGRRPTIRQARIR
jgi:putative endonuclease